jgi:subtilisin family serine protease
MAAHRIRLGAVWMLCTVASGGSHAALAPQASIAIGARLAGQTADQRAPQTAIRAGQAAARLAVSGVRPRASTAPAFYSKLDGSLAEIAQRYSALPGFRTLAQLHVLNPAARFRLSAPLATPEVLIDAVARGNPQDLRNALQNLGLRGASVFSNDVGGWLPVDQIAAAAQLAQLRFARASMPRTRGPVALQGDFAQGTFAVRSTYPTLTGAGVTVGVLSDSFNCYQVYADNGVPASGSNGYASNGFTADYATDEQSGALPQNVNVVKDASCTEYGAPDQLPFTDEGRAMLQIVYAVAPVASLAFYTASESEADFASGIVALEQAGAKVIADDVGYPDEPFFQDGVIAQAVDQVAADGVAYFSAAGNDARFSYENSTPSFVASGSQLLLNFDTSGQTTTTSLPLTIPELIPGEYVFLVVEWDQPYVTGAPGSPGASSSIDLCITSASGSDLIVNYNGEETSCTGANAIGADPVQILIIGNPANSGANSASESVSISIALASGTQPGLIKFVLEGDGVPGLAIDQFATNSPTIQGHPGAAGAAAIGAAWYFETPQCGNSPAVLESFSSAGGDRILFDTSGQPLSPSVLRQKPELVGPDGPNDTFLGFTEGPDTSIPQCSSLVQYPNFFGTSAATPHAAGAAALMWQANPAVTATQIIEALESSASPMGQSTPNYDSGYGFIQANAALALLPPAAPTLSVSPTSITVGQSATLTWSSISTTGCTASGSWTGAEAVSGSLPVTPAAAGSDTYTLMCSGPGGSASSSVKLSVMAQSTSSGSGGGGGGSIDAATLLALLATALARWQRRQSGRTLRAPS